MNFTPHRPSNYCNVVSYSKHTNEQEIKIGKETDNFREGTALLYIRSCRFYSTYLSGGWGWLSETVWNPYPPAEMLHMPKMGRRNLHSTKP